MNIEANHATLAGHTFEHELRTAIVNGSFGSIDANEGDYLLGWDTDQFPRQRVQRHLLHDGGPPRRRLYQRRPEL